MTVRVGIGQWHAVPGAAPENLETALAVTGALADRGCEVVVLPELWSSGYDHRTLAGDVAGCAEPLDGPRGRALAAAARAAGVWLFAGSVPEQAGGATYNTAPVYGPDGELRAAHRKAHLYTALGEDLVFRAGDEATVVDAGPLGRVGLSTCFDGDHAGYSRALRNRGARVVVSVSAYEVAAARWWDLLHPAQALAHGQWWLMANQRGGTGPTALLGGSRVLAPDGGVVAEAPRSDPDLPTRSPDLLVTDLDLGAALAAWDETSSLLWTATRDDLVAPPRPGPGAAA